MMGAMLLGPQQHLGFAFQIDVMFCRLKEIPSGTITSELLQRKVRSLPRNPATTKAL